MSKSKSSERKSPKKKSRSKRKSQKPEKQAILLAGKSSPKDEEPLDTGERKNKNDGQWWREFHLDDIRNVPGHRRKKSRVSVHGSAFHAPPTSSPTELGEWNRQLEEIKSDLAQRVSQISYSEKEPSPVFQNFSELEFEQTSQALAETSDRIAVKPDRPSLALTKSNARFRKPKKGKLSLLRQPTIQQIKDPLAESVADAHFKIPEAEPVILRPGKVTTVYHEPKKPVETPVTLAEFESVTQLAEPEKCRLSRSQATTVLEERVPESPKLVAETTNVAIGTEPVKLQRRKATTVLEPPKQPVVELSLTEHATELEEPSPEPAEIVKLHRSKFSIKMKEPTVKFEPVRLSVTQTATVLKEPVKPVEEPIKLRKSKASIKIKQPIPEKIDLVQARSEFDHQSESAALTRQSSGLSLSEKRPPAVHLAEIIDDVTVFEEKPKLAKTNKSFDLEGQSDPKQKLVLSNTSRDLDHDQQVLVLDNMSRDFSRDEVAITENGLDVEEEYDWSYLKWFASGVATKYILSGKKERNATRNRAD